MLLWSALYRAEELASGSEAGRSAEVELVDLRGDCIDGLLHKLAMPSDEDLD